MNSGADHKHYINDVPKPTLIYNWFDNANKNEKN